jgi:hypothetical protein
VFRQPQSAVLATYRPSGRGSPAGRPTVSPGCVTDEAWAIRISTHIDSAPAAATLIQLSCICAPDFAASSCVWNICCCFHYSAIKPTFSKWRPRLSPERPALILRRNHAIEQSVASYSHVPDGCADVEADQRIYAPLPQQMKNFGSVAQRLVLRQPWKVEQPKIRYLPTIPRL